MTLYTSYQQDSALLNTPAKRLSTLAIVVGAMALPFLLEDAELELLARGCVMAIAAIGLGLVTGYAGQVSLGHAFFMGVGAYTAAMVSGDPADRTIGFGMTSIFVWLPVAGLVTALFGLAVAPLATRLRGLYLAVVTLGLVFIGLHLFKEWKDLTGGFGVGRPAAVPDVFGIRLDLTDAFLTKSQKLFWLMLLLLIIFAVGARNLARSKVGRAFMAIRDRDIAAGVMGVNLSRYKTVAFAVSSFYAGCAGALLFTIGGFVEPSFFSLLLSVQVIAMVLIGGPSTVSGAIAGASFITLLPRITTEIRPPFVSPLPFENPNIFQLETILYGLLIIAFLIFEPRGLIGIWVRVRNYWKSFPFSH